MTRRLLLLSLIAWGTLSAASAEDANPPPDLAGFLKPGIKLGVTPQDESQSMKLLIFPDKEFEILQDAKIMDQDELAEKHPEFAAARDAELKKFTESLESRKHELPAGVTYGEPRVGLYGYHNMLLCTVAHVGDDYFLVTYGFDEVKRKVFATRFVTSISWQDKLPLSTSVSRITEN